jgi:hypothetical protein
MKPQADKQPIIGKTTLTLAVGGATLLCAASLAVRATSAPQDSARVESARVALEKWADTRRLISKERNDWVLGKELLNDRIALISREIESLRTRLQEASGSIVEADRKVAELAADEAKLKEGSAALVKLVEGFEERTKTLVKRLPDPIRERIKLLSQRLPDAATAKLSLSERFQNVVGILNEVNKFQRDIAVLSEVRTLADGSSAEVTTVYFGLGQAYYATANGKAAGRGSATADGWGWVPVNEAAGEISRMIAVLKNEQVAAFVPVPLRVDG